MTLAACAALSACGGGDDDKSDDATASTSASPAASASTSGPAAVELPSVELPSGACDLLSADEVSDVVGAKVHEGSATSGPTTSGGEFSSCVYASADPDHPADTATIVLYPNTDAADQGRGEDAQPINGLGDRAYASTFGSVWVYVDDISLFTQWYAFDGTDQMNLPKSKALAKAVIEQLA